MPAYLLVVISLLLPPQHPSHTTIFEYEDISNCLEVAAVLNSRKNINAFCVTTDGEYVV